MDVLTVGPTAAGDRRDPIALVARSSRRTNYLLVVLTVVLIALTGLLVDLAIQLNEGTVSLGAVSVQKACGDAQQIADYNDAGQAIDSQRTPSDATQAQSSIAAARQASVEALAADATGSGNAQFSRAARDLAEEYLTNTQSLASRVMPDEASGPARTVYSTCRADGNPVLSPSGARSLTP